MALLLGVDTGGTYTDAVLLRDEVDVIASAKALTTRADLAIGVGAAIRAVLQQSGARAEDIALASLSTTLATNALVEGQGGRVALVFIGFRDGDLEKHGLREALKGDPAVVLAGGHSHAGSEAAALDVAALEAFLDSRCEGVSGFAVAAQFATRNPAHEVLAAQIIAERTGAPVTCSHQLSAKLNGPKRAVTAVLNARLIGLIDRLIGRAQDTLVDLGVTAPMMVVRGDGALMSAEQARVRPIETILSGPAASIVGARWLTGADEALVSDIGGTTTDVALLRGGKPAIDPQGARVGGFRTMVEAVAMHTSGLGGDSQVQAQSEGLQGGVFLGPRRVVPVSLIAQEAPGAVHAALEAQLRDVTPGEHDGRFVRAMRHMPTGGLSAREQALLERLGDAVHPLGAVLRTRMEQGALGRLVDRGLVQLAGVTPSDASHVLGRLTDWDGAAAHKALALFARRRIGSGDMLAPSAEALAQMIVDQLTEQTALTLLETAFAEEAETFGLPPDLLARHVLTQRGLSGHRGLVALDAALHVDVVGLGASAPSYYPAVGDRLHCRMILPRHAGVANAIGAVVGRVTMRQSGTVTSPSEGRFRVHLDSGPEDFAASDAAMERLEAVLRARANGAALAAGAEGIQITVERDIKTARTEARAVFVEAQITVQASGRPRVAVG
ncbi:hydantoinase/oxoprolinase N-terminal domain-containing protein [Sedimentitalea nanhaiensis]|uniref:N-methylhydantoinase A/oxoprolinase/acetone carboxylase, beta subunit n=1 Tax=Sedimentitalea nanhaiensis TaxID=999627 RepID=A0A1I7DDT0_9RHOB|nr:hydantoinase/oxoprolinase family protein [Sedimentitalea nanhaiensis]SFU09893.1 N-methylhydantoinase A/oxoprolinase/acetone carboxylase, beta subunit [Sedimentitalea nanhaiensis]